uniref:Uncharacterized protein n=1 Tax=Macrostomum lignano TaxID=282301 RepID=A0A1I8FGN2_9PLAT
MQFGMPLRQPESVGMPSVSSRSSNRQAHQGSRNRWTSRLCGCFSANSEATVDAADEWPLLNRR